MRLTPLRHRRRAAFATLVAIILMGLIALMLTTVGMIFAADARRTRSQRDDAQLRQLLTAGAVMARNQLDRSPTTQPTAVALPSEIESKLNITLAREKDGDHVTATVHAAIGRRSVEQVVRFERRSGKWQAATATLQP